MSAKEKTQREITNDLTQYVLKIMRLNGHKVKRNNTTGIIGRRKVKLPEQELGWGDVVGCTRTGRYVEIEIKTGDDKISERQENHRDEILSSNGLHFVVESKNHFDKIYKSIK